MRRLIPNTSRAWYATPLNPPLLRGEATRIARTSINWNPYKLRIRWLGYVIMPEHVHLLVWPHGVGDGELVPISIILHDLKQFAGREGKAALRDIWRQNGSLGTRPMDDWATGAGPKTFWKTRAYDFNVTNEGTLKEKLDYMHKNPIKRGLVGSAEQWRWSSYRFLELGDAFVIEMDWDGGWPIETIPL